MQNYPTLGGEKFMCPHCDSIAKQDWFHSRILSSTVNSIYEHSFFDYRRAIRDYEQNAIKTFLDKVKDSFPKQINTLFPSDLAIATCQSCNNFSIWINKDMVYPRNIAVDMPNDDLDDNIKELYNEAAKIFNDSPKGATALLRLALHRLLNQLGKDGKNLNKDIKELVAEGLNPNMQKALDFVRVIGNHAVHPGEINLDDNKEIALKLFKILNFIADDMITKPKEMEVLYQDIIPDDTKEHISQRDGKNS